MYIKDYFCYKRVRGNKNARNRKEVTLFFRHHKLLSTYLDPGCVRRYEFLVEFRSCNSDNSSRRMQREVRRLAYTESFKHVSYLCICPYISICCLHVSNGCPHRWVLCHCEFIALLHIHRFTVIDIHHNYIDFCLRQVWGCPLICDLYIQRVKWHSLSVQTFGNLVTR